MVVAPSRLWSSRISARMRTRSSASRFRKRAGLLDLSSRGRRSCPTSSWLRLGCAESEGLPVRRAAPLDLYDSPANAFVAGFIGSPAMNIFPATTGENGVIRLQDGTTLSRAATVPPGADVLCGIRPEHIWLDKQGAPAVVRFVQMQGAETLIAARVGPVDLTIIVHDRLSLGPDDGVRIAFDPSRIHFFDPQSRKRTAFNDDPEVTLSEAGLRRRCAFARYRRRWHQDPRRAGFAAGRSPFRT